MFKKLCYALYYIPIIFFSCINTYVKLLKSPHNKFQEFDEFFQMLGS